MRCLLFAVPILSFCLLAENERPLLDYTPPGTRAIAGVHIRDVIDSALAASLSKGFVSSSNIQTLSSPFPGVNPFKDLDDVVLASTLEGEPPSWLVVCRGRFPAQEIQNGAELYHGIPIRQVRGGAFALLDPGTLVGGDIKQVREAVDRRNAPTRVMDAALAQRADRLSKRYAVWGAGSVPRTFHPPAGTPDGFGSLRRFDFGVALQKSLELVATLGFEESADAKKLGSLIELIQALSRGQEASNGAKVETSFEHGDLTISMRVPEEVLQKALAEQKADLSKVLSQAASGATGVDLLNKLGAIRPEKSAAPPRPAAPIPGPKVVSDDKGNTLLVILPGKR